MQGAKVVAVCLLLMIVSSEAINHSRVYEDATMKLGAAKAASRMSRKLIAKIFRDSQLEEDSPAEAQTTGGVVKSARMERCKFEGERGCLPAETFWEKWGTMIKFLAGTILCMILSGVAAFAVTNAKNRERGQPVVSFGDFMGSKVISGAGVGMASGIVFGFLDNFGLFFGMDLLDPLLKKLPFGTEPLMVAGYGNTFSDMVGAFAGVFIGKIIEEVSDVRDYPIWAGAFGIFLGCLLGVFIPRLIHHLMEKKPGKEYSEEEIEMLVRVASGDKINVEDIDTLMSLFDGLPKVGKGREIKLEDLKEVPELQGEMMKLFKKADEMGPGAEGDGLLTREQFRQAVVTAAGQTYVPPDITTKSIPDALYFFDKIDKKFNTERQGSATVQDLCKMPSLRPMRAEMYYADLVDGNKDGWLSREEFQSAISNHIANQQQGKEERTVLKEVFNNIGSGSDCVTLSLMREVEVIADLVKTMEGKGCIKEEEFWARYEEYKRNTDTLVLESTAPVPHKHGGPSRVAPVLP